jgi:predicted ribonuclease YlaK
MGDAKDGRNVARQPFGKKSYQIEKGKAKVITFKTSLNKKRSKSEIPVKNQEVKKDMFIDSDGCYYNDRLKINAIIASFDVLVQDPLAIDQLRKGGNILYIPLAVLNQLKSLCDKPEIGADAQEALQRIEALRGDDSLIIYKDYDHKVLEGLDNKNEECLVIAAAADIVQRNRERYRRVKLLSLNPGIRILAREKAPLLKVEDYIEAHVYLSAKNIALKRVNIRYKDADGEVLIKHDIDNHIFYFDYVKTLHAKEIYEDEFVVCRSDFDPTFKPDKATNKKSKEVLHLNEAFLAYRENDRMIIVLKNDKIEDKKYTLFGLTPYTKEGDKHYNWEQLVAIHRLKSKKYDNYFIAGAAGSGKSLLGCAMALERYDDFKEIIILVTMVHAGDRDNIGFLPGDLGKKLAVWERTTDDSLAALEQYAPGYGFYPPEKERVVYKNGNGNGNGNGSAKYSPAKNTEAKYKKNSKANKQQANNPIDTNGQNYRPGWLAKKLKDDKLVFWPIDFIRGRTFQKTLIIVEDAQNLSRSDTKLILTRAGEGTVIIFNGDVGQVDRTVRQYGVTRILNGFANAWVKLDRPGTAKISLIKTVRSKLAEDSEKML